MTDVLALQQVIPIVAFGATSRYANLPTATIVVGGRTLVYVRRRFCPDPATLAVLGVHTVTQGERLDQIAARELGDAELFWRVCDGNRALRPEELTATVGRRLTITLPEGVPGIVNA